MVKTKIIDGVEFTVAPFMAVEALKLKAFLVKTFGPALVQVIGTLQRGLPKNGSIADINLDGSALAGAIETLMSQLDEDSFIDLIKRLFANMTAKGKDESSHSFMRQFDTVNFDAAMQTVFSGRLFTIYPVMALVLEVNYPDFFEKTVRNIGSRIGLTSTSASANASATSNSETSDI